MEPEILIRREIISNDDLQKRLGIKRTKACQIMQEIKSVSNILGIAGRVHERDYQIWLSEKEKRDEKTKRKTV